MNWNEILELLPVIMQWAIAVAIIAFLLDIFLFQCEIISYLAVFVLICAGVILLGIPMVWGSVIIVIASLLAFGLVHVLWDKVLNPFFNKCLMKDVKVEEINKVVGQVGSFRLIEGSPFISWNGELWPTDASPENFADQEKVIITANKGGVFSITKREAAPAPAPQA